MKKQQKVQSTPPSPEIKGSRAMSKVPIDIDGTTYYLSFEMAELAKAERFYRSQGHHISLVLSFSQFTMDSMREVFPCAVRKHHPELEFSQAQELVTLKSMMPIALVVAAAMGADTTPVAAE